MKNIFLKFYRFIYFTLCGINFFLGTYKLVEIWYFRNFWGRRNLNSKLTNGNSRSNTTNQNEKNTFVSLTILIWICTFFCWIRKTKIIEVVCKLLSLTYNLLDIWFLKMMIMNFNAKFRNSFRRWDKNLNKKSSIWKMLGTMILYKILTENY